MPSIFDQLIKRGILKKGEYPPFLRNAVHYETIMGSIAYAVNEDTSDFDVYGVFIPPKEYIFPHITGHILGFGKQPPTCNTWQKHHINDPEAEGGKGRGYDLNFCSIVHYFEKCKQGNPNMIDSLFTPQRCILHTTSVGEIIRENRYLFLHKGAWQRFKGYAFQQMRKMQSQKREGKRKEVVEKYGYDLKFAYHVVRLLNEIEQILTEGELDLERNREQLKSIRRGEWTKERIIKYFEDKEKSLEEVYSKSDLPWGPDEEKIKQVLLQCLEIVYDDIHTIVQVQDRATVAIGEIADILRKHNLQ